MLTARLRSNGRAGVAVVCIGQVVEGRQVNGKDTHSSAANSDSWDNPVDGRERAPTKPEQADRKQNRLDANEVQTAFGRGGELAEFGGDVVLPDTDAGDEDDTDAHCWFC